MDTLMFLFTKEILWVVEGNFREQIGPTGVSRELIEELWSSLDQYLIADQYVIADQLLKCGQNEALSNLWEILSLTPITTLTTLV